MYERMTYLEPWVPIGQDAVALVAELRNEVTENHPLWGIEARAIARRTDSDDVLFELGFDETKLAVVHLTWSGHLETDSRWPSTRFFASLSEWIREGMSLDHRQFTHSD